jgi:hypothetical protein
MILQVERPVGYPTLCLGGAMNGNQGSLSMVARTFRASPVAQNASLLPRVIDGEWQAANGPIEWKVNGRLPINGGESTGFRICRTQKGPIDWGRKSLSIIGRFNGTMLPTRQKIERKPPRSHSHQSSSTRASARRPCGPITVHGAYFQRHSPRIPIAIQGGRICGAGEAELRVDSGSA